MSEMYLKQVGIAHTPYETSADAPHQGFAANAESTIEILEEYERALSGIDSVHRVTVVYWAHEAGRSSLVGHDGDGAFTRRSPHRPNPLNICTCLLLEVDGRRLRVRGLDAIDGSAVVDIKPALQAER